MPELSVISITAASPESHVPWQEIEERLLLDRINMGGDDARMYYAVVGALLVLAHPAGAAITGGDSTLTRTQLASTLLPGGFS